MRKRRKIKQNKRKNREKIGFSALFEGFLAILDFIIELLFTILNPFKWFD